MPIAARARRTAWWALALAVVSGLVYLMATASTGPVDPTEVGGHEEHATVVANSAIIVFREGLEAVRHDLPFTVSPWLGSWFEIYGTWETVGAQLLAAAFVIGSYFLAQHVKVTRPARRGEQPAVRAEAPPAEPALA